MLRGESLPSISYDAHSVAGYSTIAGDMGPAIGGGRVKMITTKFSYSAEVGRAFKRVIQFMEAERESDGDRPDSVVDRASKFYKPNKYEIRIVHFPKIYRDLLSMRPSSYSSHDYLKKKIADSKGDLDISDIELSKKKRRPSADNSSQGQKQKKSKVVKATAMEQSSHSPSKLPTIFELTTTGTPGKKTKPKTHLLKG